MRKFLTLAVLTTDVFLGGAGLVEKAENYSAT